MPRSATTYFAPRPKKNHTLLLPPLEGLPESENCHFPPKTGSDHFQPPESLLRVRKAMCSLSVPQNAPEGGSGHGGSTSSWRGARVAQRPGMQLLNIHQWQNTCLPFLPVQDSVDLWINSRLRGHSSEDLLHLLGWVHVQLLAFPGRAGKDSTRGPQTPYVRDCVGLKPFKPG